MVNEHDMSLYLEANFLRINRIFIGERARHSQVYSIENRDIHMCVCHSTYVTFVL